MALAELRSENERLSGALQGTDSADGEIADLKERYQMALDDVRKLRSENERLGSSLREVQKSIGTAPGNVFDWETQKKQLLAQLESDFDRDDPTQAKDRLTVEGAIQITDQVVAEKEQRVAEQEQEIQALKQLLEQQATQVGSATEEMSAIAELLDGDELICAERENLRRLQIEWREKLRQAEVDTSLERAKLARERARLDEEQQSIKQEREQYGVKSDSSSDAGEPRQARRWLARLGIKDD